MKQIKEASNRLNFATVSAFIRKVVLDYIDAHYRKKRR